MTSMFFRHYWIRLRTVVRQPSTFVMLPLAGLASTWPFYLLSFRRRWQSPEDMAAFAAIHVLLILLWPALAALPVSGSAAQPARGTAGGRLLPALPIGPYSRTLSEALVALTLLLVVRTPLIAYWWTDRLLSLMTRQTEGLHLAAASLLASFMARDALLALLVALPVLVAWCALPRLDATGILRTTAVAAIATVAALLGISAEPRTALPFSLTLTALALVLPGHRWSFFGQRTRKPKPAKHTTIPWRVSPGPSAQLRKDSWLGTVREHWLLVSLIVLLAAAVGLAVVTDHRGLGAWLSVILLLAGLPALFVPLGVSLVSSAGTGATALFSGHFGAAWSTLPVRREAVLRAVYCHGLVVSGFLCISFCTVAFVRSPLSALAFELPAVPLLAACLLCAASGDRRRGFLALGSLIAFQFGLPVLLASVPAGGPGLLSNPYRALVVSAWVLALVGGIPPLVHLRRPTYPA